MAPCNSSVVSIALGPGDSQMNKTVSAQKKLVAVCGGESRGPRISAWCAEHHSQDTGEGGKEAGEGPDEGAARKAKPKLSTQGLEGQPTERARRGKANVL